MATPSDHLAGITHVGLDADDTLWHSEDRFRAVHQQYLELLATHVDLDLTELEARLLDTERANLRLFGYGAKGFTLSLIETAIEVTDARIPASDLAVILRFGKDLLDHPVDLLPGVAPVIDRLTGSGKTLVLVSKGDLWHQESKIAASGLADRFAAIEIVSEKDEATYTSVLARLGVTASSFCMVGNSVRSDILPVLAIGAAAVHVPYPHLWSHEDVPAGDADFPVLDSITELPALLGL